MLTVLYTSNVNFEGCQWPLFLFCIFQTCMEGTRIARFGKNVTYVNSFIFPRSCFWRLESLNMQCSCDYCCRNEVLCTNGIVYHLFHSPSLHYLLTRQTTVQLMRCMYFQYMYCSMQSQSLGH